MQKISLVTGGAGFIGAHCARELLKMGHKVIILDDLSGGFEENLPKEADFIKGSINDEELIKNLFSKYKFNYVYHLAAYAAENLSHFIRKFNYENNLIGSINLINEAVKSKIERFVFTSSIAAYGEVPLPARETTVPNPEDPYGIAKLAVEQDLKVAHRIFGLKYTIFRPHNVYGSFQNIGDMYRNVVGIFMNKLLQGKSLPIFGDGLQTRAFSHINDVAPYIANCVENDATINEVFNIGADQDHTVLEIANHVMAAMGEEGKIEFLPARQEVKHIFADHAKAKKVFGINSFVSIEEGIKEMASWVNKTGTRASNKFENIEIFENLPESWKTT